MKTEEKVDWVGIKTQLESQQIIMKWLQFNNLPKPHQDAIWKEWDEYYKACRESPMGKLSRDLADAIKRNDNPAIDGLRQLHKDLKAMGNTVPKPKASLDPMVFYHDQQVYLYKRALVEIERGRTKLAGF